MLGTLAKRLRILGIDALYFRKIDDSLLVDMTVSTGRLLLTMDRGLALRTVKYGAVLLLDIDVDAQVNRLREKFADVFEVSEPFTRCLRCNDLLTQINDKSDVLDEIPEYVYRTQSRFARCPSCKRIYWQGTHLDNMKSLINEEK